MRYEGVWRHFGIFPHSCTIPRPPPAVVFSPQALCSQAEMGVPPGRSSSDGSARVPSSHNGQDRYRLFRGELPRSDRKERRVCVLDQRRSRRPATKTIRISFPAPLVPPALRQLPAPRVLRRLLALRRLRVLRQPRVLRRLLARLLLPARLPSRPLSDVSL